MNDIPKTSKGSAVQMWNDAVGDLPDEEPYGSAKEKLSDYDIHDQSDRWYIEEIVEHEIPYGEYYTPLADAWHQVKQEFDY